MGRFDWALLAAAVLLAIAASWFVGGVIGWLLMFATLSVLAYLFRGMWLPRLRAAVDWAKRLRAEWIARRDDAPSYWEGEAKNEEHQRYRDEYLRLATQPTRTRADLALLAEMLDGLAEYGDNPLAKPPTLQRRAIAEFAAAGTALNVGLGRWTWIVGLGLVATCIALFGWVKIEQANARLSCSDRELQGYTDRQPCLDQAAAEASAGRLRDALEAFQAVRPVDVGGAVQSARETAELNQRRAGRRSASDARRRRAQDDDVSSVRDNRAPDWGQRLRDLTGDPTDGGADAGAAPGDGAASGVSGDGGGAADVPDTDAAAGTGNR